MLYPILWCIGLIAVLLVLHSVNKQPPHGKIDKYISAVIALVVFALTFIVLPGLFVVGFYRAIVGIPACF